jgi:hypothetical protein
VSLLVPGYSSDLPCFNTRVTVEYEGKTFAALHPVDTPVMLAEMRDDRLVRIDESEEPPELLDACVQACAALDIDLLETPVMLTAAGPGLDALDGEREMLQLAYDVPEEFVDGEDDDEEEAFVLAEVEHDGRILFVLESVDMAYVIGKESGESYVVASDRELEVVQEPIDEMIQEFESEFEAEEEMDEIAHAPPPSQMGDEDFTP